MSPAPIHAGSRDLPDARIAALEEEHPEWGPWLGLARVTAGALNGAWCDVGADAASTAGVPLLEGRTLRVDGSRLSQLLAELLGAAAEPGAGPSREVEPELAVALLEAATRGDEEQLVASAVELGVPADLLTSVTDFLARPPLHAAAARLGRLVPTHWPHGYCPVCGGAALLAELRGVDQARMLRCGRCGCAWSMPWLRCAHCGEDDHERLGTLVPADEGERLKVEVCASCGGYLKSIATLGTSSLIDLLLSDIETVELDLVALDRGYRRPAGGRPPAVRVMGLVEGVEGRGRGGRAATP